MREKRDFKKRRSSRTDMQRNGLLGQEFVSVKTERRCVHRNTRLHADTHTEGCFIRVSTLVGDRPA